MTLETLPPEAQMMKIILGKWISKPVYAVAELGIPDILADGGKSVQELSDITSTHEETLCRLMRALACIGIFRETVDTVYENTPLSDCLKKGRLRDASLLFNSSWHDRMWSNLLYTVRTGKPSFEALFQKPVFEWFQDHPDEAETFHQANAFKAATSHRVLLDTCNFADIKRIADIGGGFGGLMTEIVKTYPEITGTVVELPETAARLSEILESSPLKNRITVESCNFFDSVPPGNEIYLLSHILHDWPDEQCISLLKNCRSAMEAESKLIILESVIPTGNSFSMGKLLDLEVLLMGGGKERTADEFRFLMKQSGFRISQIIPTYQNISVIEAVPV